jgi:hypothetical protein
LEDFAKHAGVKATQLPNAVDAAIIKKEEEQTAKTRWRERILTALRVVEKRRQEKEAQDYINTEYVSEPEDFEDPLPPDLADYGPDEIPPPSDDDREPQPPPEPEDYDPPEPDFEPPEPLEPDDYEIPDPSKSKDQGSAEPPGPDEQEQPP